MAEVVAEVLLQAQTDVLVEVAADPGGSPQSMDAAVAQVLPLLFRNTWLRGIGHVPY